MTVRRESAELRSETGAWSRKEGGILEQDVERPSGEPARRQAGRSREAAIAGEAPMNQAD